MGAIAREFGALKHIRVLAFMTDHHTVAIVHHAIWIAFALGRALR